MRKRSSIAGSNVTGRVRDSVHIRLFIFFHPVVALLPGSCSLPASQCLLPGNKVLFNAYYLVSAHIVDALRVRSTSTYCSLTVLTTPPNRKDPLPFGTKGEFERRGKEKIGKIRKTR